MKIKRFFAEDVRGAIRAVRDELGVDAVILSNREVAGGIEIVAAVDYDENLVNNYAADTSTGAPAELPAEAINGRPSVTLAKASETYQSAAERYEAPPAHERSARSAAPMSDIPAGDGATVPPAHSRESTRAHAATRIEWSQEPTLVEMRREMEDLRGMMQSQLSSLAWGDLARRNPYRAKLLQQLLDLGMAPAVCRELADRTPPDEDFDRVWRRALGELSHRIPVADDDILDQGGMIALVGPTGVGKTTTIAKLAARFVLRHGARSVALISTDGYRIGAHEQLRAYGRILDIPVRIANDGQELHDALVSLSDRRLVLIDTAGMSQRDVRLSEQFALMARTGFPIQNYLVLSATTQRGGLDEALRAFSESNLRGCILTKVDEAASLGAALSVTIEHRLPVAYVTDGQRVPEDIRPARPHTLVTRAVELMRQGEKSLQNELLAMVNDIPGVPATSGGTGNSGGFGPGARAHG